MKRVEAHDAFSICMLADSYRHGLNGLQQDEGRAMELYVRAAELGCSKAHYQLGDIYHEGGNLKKAKFHLEAAAIAGDEVARFNVGVLKYNSGNIEQSLKHWTIGATAGDYKAIFQLKTLFDRKEVVTIMALMI
jgi:TPR repeat protein